MKLYLISMKDIDYPLSGLGDYYGFVVKAHNIVEAINAANFKAGKIYNHMKEKGLVLPYNDIAIIDNSEDLVFDESGVSQPFYFINC